VPSNVASLWTLRGSETIIGGTLQGRKQFSVKGASQVSKRRMWVLAIATANEVQSSSHAIVDSLKVEKYVDVKNGDLLERRKETKADIRSTLKGWQRNDDSEDWSHDGVGV
jgi:tRNA-specific adenosine deaminase 1